VLVKKKKKKSFENTKHALGRDYENPKKKAGRRGGSDLGSNESADGGDPSKATSDAKKKRTCAVTGGVNGASSRGSHPPAPSKGGGGRALTMTRGPGGGKGPESHGDPLSDRKASGPQKSSYVQTCEKKKSGEKGAVGKPAKLTKKRLGGGSS